MAAFSEACSALKAQLLVVQNTAQNQTKIRMHKHLKKKVGKKGEYKERKHKKRTSLIT
jgi:hypothetical protein